jgi:hypothetical protein
MEGANEAARRAVNGILERSGSSASPCQLWKLHEPAMFEPIRSYDRQRWKAGLPWDDMAVNAALSALNVASSIVPLPMGHLAISAPRLRIVQRH